MFVVSDTNISHHRQIFTWAR